MYRLPRTTNQKEHVKTSNVKSESSSQTSNNGYELLWRKKSNKMHKRWEGDAIGILRTSGPQLMLEIQADGRKLASVKLETTSLDEGRILSSNSYEFEVGASIDREKPSSSPCSTSNSKFRVPIMKPPLEFNGPVTNTSVLSAQGGDKPLVNTASMTENVAITNFSGPKTPIISKTSVSKASIGSKTPMGLKPPTRFKVPVRSTTVGSTESKAPIGSISKGPTSKGPTSKESSSIEPASVVPASVGPTLMRSTSKASSASKRPFSFDTEQNWGRFKTPFKIPLKVQNAPISLSNWEIDQQLLQHLRPHQVAGVEFIINSVLGKQHRHGNGCILADEMGLGKTLTSISAVHSLLKYKHIQNALIVCPVTLIANWKAEFAKWLPTHRNPQFGVLAVDQNGLGNSSLKDPVLRFFSDRQFKSFQVMIIGYERVRLVLPQLNSLNKRFDLVVCDEGHRLKTTNSKTADAIEQCCEDKRVILSGTPVQNDLGEFWALAQFVNPGVFGSEASFNRKYAVPMSSEKAVDVKRDEAVEELMEICDDFMLRRDISVIEKYVNVPKREYVVFCRPTPRQTAKYQQVLDGVSDGLFGSTAGNIDQGACLQAINELRKIAAGDKHDQGGKLQFLGNLLDSLRRQSPEEKIVIVSGSTRVLDLCQDICISKRVSWLRLDGSTPQDKRQSSVQMFNKHSANACCAFLLSSRSGGMGLNLIGGSRLVLLDCDWNPAIDAQVMGRIHRDGQKRPCFIYRLLTTGSIDEKIFQRQLSKINISQHILVTATANNTTPDFSRDMLRDLFGFSVPEKCNTLETTFHASGIKGYTETTLENGLALADPVLASACSMSGNVSCLFTKQEHDAGNEANHE